MKRGLQNSKGSISHGRLSPRPPAQNSALFHQVTSWDLGWSSETTGRKADLRAEADFVPVYIDFPLKCAIVDRALERACSLKVKMGMHPPSPRLPPSLKLRRTGWRDKESGKDDGLFWGARRAGRGQTRLNAVKFFYFLTAFLRNPL
jgi:hypothetical protein